MARVLLIKPPNVGFAHEVTRYFPVGLAYLAAVLRRAGHAATIFDALADVGGNHIVPRESFGDLERVKLQRSPRLRHLIHWGADWSTIADVVRREAPDVVGISCMFSPYAAEAHRVAAIVRGVVPDASIVMGGQHPSVAPRAVLRDRNIDIITLGEAEDTIVPLVDALVRGTDFSNLEGVGFRDASGAIILRPRSQWRTDLNALPFPQEVGIDPKQYGGVVTLITSRGCPFSCSFCSVHAVVGRKFRTRTPANIVDEIEAYIRNDGVRHFSIEDDNFTFDTKRVHDICDEIVQRGLDIELRLPNGITSVKLTEELVGAMARAGFRELFIGLETTNPERLRRIAKRFTSFEKVQRGVDLFVTNRVEASTSLIVGLIDQTLAEFARDVALLFASGIRFWANAFYPIPGTPDFDRLGELGIVSSDTEFGLYDQFNFAFGNDDLTPARLYWAWATTLAMLEWSPLIARELKKGSLPKIDLLAAAENMRRHSEVRRRRSDIAAQVVRIASDQGRLVVDLSPESCFCASHRLRYAGGTEGCGTLSGDFVACGLSLLTGEPVSARQVCCRGSDGGNRCAFEIERGGDELMSVTSAFRQALGEVLLSDTTRARAATMAH